MKNVFDSQSSYKLNRPMVQWFSIVMNLQPIDNDFLLCRMQKINYSEYHIVPATWVLPADHTSLGQWVASMRRRKKKTTLIVKPHNGAMGNG